jgi:hypothetical protein
VGAVALVDVEVEDEHSPCPSSQDAPRRDDVVEEAVAATRVRERMVRAATEVHRHAIVQRDARRL